MRRVTAAWLLTALAVGLAALVFVAVSVVWPQRSGVPETNPDLPADAQPMVVDEVLSGDILVLSALAPGPQVPRYGQITARLINIDAPNFGIPSECFAIEALAGLVRILPVGSIAWIATDVTPQDEGGRWLVNVWSSSGSFVNAGMVAAGLVKADEMSPNLSLFPPVRAAQNYASSGRIGLWGQCST